MKEKARIPLLVCHIVSNVGMMLLMGIIFVVFNVGGVFAGAIGSIGGAEAGGEVLGKVMLTGYVLDMFLALVVILDVVNLICGFRKKPSGKVLSIFMIIDMCLTSLITTGVAAYLLRNYIADILAGGTEVIQNSALIVVVSLILLVYLALYILTIIFIYVPRIKTAKKNA